MPYNIPQGNQQYSSGGTQARSQNWYFNPPQVQALSSLHILQALPPDQDVTVGIRDMVNSSYASTHSAFELVVTITQDAGAPDLFNVTSSSHDISQAIALTPTTDLTMLLSVAFVDPTILLEGNYVGYVNFTVSAVNNATSLREDIDFRSYQMTLERSGETWNGLRPRVMNIAYLQGTTSPTEFFDLIPSNMNSSNLQWQLGYENDLNISIPGTVGSNPPYTVISGNNPQRGSLSLNETVWDTRSVGFHDTLFNVLFENSNEILGVDVNVAVFDAHGALISPMSLHFETTIPEYPEAQFFDIWSTQGYTITAPPWLLLSSVSGSGSDRISVLPINIEDFSEGTYNDVITVVASGNTYTIAVTLVVYDDLQTNISETNFNFTKDAKYLQVDGYDEGHYMQVDTVVRSYDIDGNSYTVEDTVKIPYFRSTARYKVGSVIHQSTRWLDDPNQVDLGLLVPGLSIPRAVYTRHTYVDFVVKIINRETGDVPLTRNVLNTKWWPGRTPRYANQGISYLNYNDTVIRIDTKGFAVLNTFCNAPTTIRLTKNGQFIGNYVLNSGDQPAERILIDGSQYERGDIIKAQMTYLANGVTITKDKFVFIYAAKEYNVHLAYRTDYNTIELLQCTGVLTGASNYNRRTNTVINNNVDINKDVLVTRDDQLILNTGYIPEDQRYMIDEIMKSKALWLVNTKYKEPIPIKVNSSELAHTDNERFLHNYVLELTVNREVDEEIYIF